jgi:hypothetical protein
MHAYHVYVCVVREYSLLFAVCLYIMRAYFLSLRLLFSYAVAHANRVRHASGKRWVRSPQSLAHAPQHAFLQICRDKMQKDAHISEVYVWLTWHVCRQDT